MTTPLPDALLLTIGYAQRLARLFAAEHPEAGLAAAAICKWQRQTRTSASRHQKLNRPCCGHANTVLGMCHKAGVDPKVQLIGPGW